MKLHLIGLVLCAFVVSTFGHEIASRHHGHFRKSHLSARGGIDGEDLNCTCPCACTTTTTLTTPTTTTTTVTPEPCTNSTVTTNRTVTIPPTPVIPVGNGSLQIYVNISVKYVAVVNVTAQVALVIDINNNIAAFFNRTSGAVIVFNFVTGIGYSISVRSSVSWNVSVEFSAFFASLNLQAVYTVAAKIGTRFTLQQVTAAISLQISIFLQAVGVYVESSQALVIWSQTVVRVSVSLRVILVLFGSGVTTASGGLLVIVARFEGIVAFFVRIGVSISALVQANIRIDLTQIFSLQTSVEIFIYIVKLIRVVIDIGGSISNNSTNIFELISTLSGNSTVGASGVITVVAQLIAVLQNRVDIQVFIQTLIAFYQNNAGTTITIQAVVQIVTNLRALAQANGWTQVVVQIDLFLSQKLVINGVNIYAVIVILLETNGVPLQCIVRILILLRQVISIEIEIARLILYLLFILRNDVNAQVIIQILVNIQYNISGSVNIWVYIVSKISITDVLRLITLGGRGLYEFLVRIPIIGDIIAAINVALRSYAQLNLSVVISGSSFTQFALQILGFFRLNISVGGSISTKHLQAHHEREGHHQHLQDKHAHLHEKHLEHHAKNLEHAGVLEHSRHHETYKHHARAKEHVKEHFKEHVKEH